MNRASIGLQDFDPLIQKVIGREQSFALTQDVAQMIPGDAMPTPKKRLALFDAARDLFLADGYDEIGIDHFARRTDGLAIAARSGHLRRNFQGYTDDRAPILVWHGASLIWRFPQGDPRRAFFHHARSCVSE